MKLQNSSLIVQNNSLLLSSQVIWLHSLNEIIFQQTVILIKLDYCLYRYYSLSNFNKIRQTVISNVNGKGFSRKILCKLYTGMAMSFLSKEKVEC